MIDSDFSKRGKDSNCQQTKNWFEKQKMKRKKEKKVNKYKNHQSKL
jgi:hypothetical protein